MLDSDPSINKLKKLRKTLISTVFELDPEPDPLAKRYGSEDPHPHPDPYQKCHRSGTLKNWVFFPLAL
jgi:hypothetical protein